jgi:hypothetical protein
MKLIVVTERGRVIGASQIVDAPEYSGEGPRAHLTAGPNQKLVELEVPEKLLPSPESPPHNVAKFLQELEKRLAEHKPKRTRVTKRGQPKGGSKTARKRF